MSHINFADLPQVIAIVGSRDFPKLRWVRGFVAKTNANTIIVSGGARGVDSAAEAACAAYDRPCKVFPVENFEWELLGKRAGHQRNGHILKFVKDYGGIVVVFAAMDEKGVMSPGSSNMVQHCIKAQVPYVIFIDQGLIKGTYLNID